MANVNASLSHSFAVVPPPEVPRSQFDRSHWHKTTFDSGVLFPIYLDLAYPGDTFNMNIDAFARVATPLVPIMDDMWIETFSFAVPIRLLWSNFKRFMGETANPGDSVDFLVPQLQYDVANPTALESLGDYFGFPVGQATNYSVSALPFRAYNLIWKEWFRAEFIQDSPVINMGDGPDSPADYPVRRRGKRHDYFTSCAPWPQNTTDVSIPAHAAVVAGAQTVGPQSLALKWGVVNTGAEVTSGELGVVSGNTNVNASTLTGTSVVYPSNLELDFTAGVSDTVNEIRQAFQIQRMLEREARTGSRYTEIIRGSFGVLSDDARQQRPEYLGGGSSPVNFHPVAQTSGTAGAGGYTDTPQGNLAAFGTASVQGHGWTKSFTEHCVVMTLACVRGPLHYQQGLAREWSYRTKYDFYWPSLALLGEQAVKNKEIYLQGTATDDEAFGFQERFAEAKYFPSRVTGKFRSMQATPLDMWHLAQKFENLPTLSSEFIEENPPLDRCVAVPSEPQFKGDFRFSLKAARPMPTHSIPGMIDHF